MLAPMEKIDYEADRKSGGDGDLENLSRSMARHGLINAITLREDAGGRYRIIAGRRRFEAAKLLGWEAIEAKVLGPSALNANELSLAENVNREDMSPLDEAELFARQLAEGADIKELALYYNRSVSAIYQRTRLARLSPGIKTLFREGKIAITAAAMLSALEEKSQEKFYEKYKHVSNISTVYVETFLHSVQKNTLMVIADKKCEGCDKRTNHTDKSLFPEEEGLKDVCFDDGCYAKKWTALLEKTMKKAKAKEPDTENMVILQSVPKFYQGDIITLDKTEYLIKKYSYNENHANEGDPEALAVWKFDVVAWNQEKIALRRIFYKEKKTKAEGKAKADKSVKSNYAPDEAIDKVIRAEPGGLTPAARAPLIRSVDRAIEKRYGPHGYENSLNSAIFKKIISRRLEKPGSLVREFVSHFMEFPGEKQKAKEIYELVAGLPCSEDLAGIETVAHEKIIILLFALYIAQSEEFLPEPDDDVEDDLFFQLGGLNKEEYKELYNETAAELVADAMAHQDDPEQEDENGDDDDDD
jgi:ParB family chromosome partitioning protein